MSIGPISAAVSEEQYLNDELTSDIRHEYINGKIFAVAGAGKNHRVLSGNIFSLFHQHLKDSPCEPSLGDARVKAANSYLYPDIVVDCDEDSSDDSLYADSPRIIVEVLSRTTRHRDRGVKLLSYINIASLEEYVLVEQEFASIEALRKRDGWVPRHYTLGDTIHFESIDLSLTVEAVYERVSNDDMDEFLSDKTNN